MKDNIIGRLFGSFEDLDQAIKSARNTLAARTNVPEEVLHRLDSYDEILLKQKKLASDLCVSIEQGDWEEVSRVVTLINGLSAMIRDDARAILSSLALNSDHTSSGEDDEIPFC